MKTQNYSDIFEPIIDLQSKWMQKISNEWGYSSVQLKKYLAMYYSEDLDYATKLGSINVNYLLPIRKGFWFGSKGVYMLSNAIKAKAVIMNSIGELEDNFGKLVYESLRLYLRIDSTRSKLSLDDFYNIINDAYIKADEKERIEEVLDLCEKFKPRRKQTVYHYSKEDFDLILPDMKLGEAYDFWINVTFPELLNNFKDKKTNEWIVKNNYVKNKGLLYADFRADLDSIQIKKLNKRSFEQQLKKFNIPYEKRTKS